MRRGRLLGPDCPEHGTDVMGCSCRAPDRFETFGYALAMRVLQSSLYRQLDETERGECDELIRRGQQ